MNQTTNYQLNQWEKADRIQMEDFNADNAKIDAALASIKELLPIVHLQTITTTAAATKLDIDLSGFDWDTYTYALIRIDGKMSSSSGSFYVRMNGYSGEYDYQYSSGGSNTQSDTYAGYCSLSYSNSKNIPLLLVSNRGTYPDVSIRTIGALARYHGILKREVALSTLSLVGSSSSYTISSGTKIDIYGIKL